MPPRWSDEEDAWLRRRYGQGAPLRVIAEELGRSPDAISERRRTLGIGARPRARPWSPIEDELLRGAAALGLPASAVADRLHRPAEQVRRRSRALVGSRPPSRSYGAAEDEAITACWSAKGDVTALARELGRPAGSVRLRAQKLDLYRPLPRARWRADEDAAVRDGYERGLTCEQIAAELAGRTPSAVAARAAKLGLSTYARTWTGRDDLVLRRLASDGVDLERAAQLLARTPEALRARARKLGIARPRSRRAHRGSRRWTSEEDELLALHCGLNPATLAELLDRSPEAITQRLRRVGLRDGAERSPHHPVTVTGELTPGQRAAVSREVRDGGPRRQLALARRLGVRPVDIRRLAEAADRRGPEAPLEPDVDDAAA